MSTTFTVAGHDVTTDLLLVISGRRRGKTTALRSVIEDLEARGVDHVVMSAAMGDLPGAAHGAAEIVELAADTADDPSVVWVIDDVDVLYDEARRGAMEAVEAAAVGRTVIASTTSTDQETASAVSRLTTRTGCVLALAGTKGGALASKDKRGRPLGLGAARIPMGVRAGQGILTTPDGAVRVEVSR